MTVAWIEQTAADLPRSLTWLTDSERERLGRFRFEKRRSDWLLGRWTAKLGVAKSLDLADRASIEIRPAVSGAPRVFVSGEPAPISISISHTGRVAMCAVALPCTWLGCDIEAIEPRSEAFAVDYFTAPERSRFSSPALITATWSAKESALKALGIGLGIDIRRLNVWCEQRTGWSPLTVDYAHLRTFHGWWYEANGLVRTIVAAPAPVGVFMI